MYNFYTMLPEKSQTWRSAYEIEIAALKHEERRIQLLDETTPTKTQQTGFRTLLTAPLRLLATLLG